MIRYVIWYDMVWYDMIWYDMLWYGMIWYDMIYDIIWYSIYYIVILICYGTTVVYAVRLWQKRRYAALTCSMCGSHAESPLHCWVQFCNGILNQNCVCPNMSAWASVWAFCIFRTVCHGLLLLEGRSDLSNDKSSSFAFLLTENFSQKQWFGFGWLATEMVDCSWKVMAHGDTREGKWRGNWRMQWVASTLHTTSEHGVSSITTADTHTSADSSRLNWRPPGRFKWTWSVSRERRNLVSAHMPSHFNWPLRQTKNQLSGLATRSLSDGTR